MTERIVGASSGSEWASVCQLMDRYWTPVEVRFRRCRVTFRPLLDDAADFLEKDGFVGRFFVSVNYNRKEDTDELVHGLVLFEDQDAAFNFKMFGPISP